MQVFDLRSKTFLISDQNPKDLDLVFHWVLSFIHLTQIDLIYWLVTLFIYFILFYFYFTTYKKNTRKERSKTNTVHIYARWN